MESKTYATLTTPTTTHTKHLNLGDFDQKYTELTALRISPPARQQPRTSTNNNTHTTKRATCNQTHTLLNDPTMATRNQHATKRDLEPSDITNGQTCNADLRRLRPLPRPMTTFDSRQLPLPLNPGLSHSSIRTPNLRISHHHKHHTWRLLHTLLHLHSNKKG